VDAVLLDLGGVVVRICRTWGEACARAGVPERAPERFGEASLARARALAVDRYQTGRMTCDAFVEEVANSTAGLYSPGEVRRIHDAWLIGEYPGVAGLLSVLSGSGVATGCLSNTNRAHWEVLREGGAVSLLRHQLVSHELRSAKPGARIYEQAEEALGLPGERIAFFDDLEENVRAAAERGWLATQIDHTGDTAAQMTRRLRELGVLAAGAELPG
jgi:FMN phosphatase YigB (HAD superfamily)